MAAESIFPDYTGATWPRENVRRPVFTVGDGTRCVLTEGEDWMTCWVYDGDDIKQYIAWDSRGIKHWYDVKEL